MPKFWAGQALIRCSQSEKGSSKLAPIREGAEYRTFSGVEHKRKARESLIALLKFIFRMFVSRNVAGKAQIWSVTSKSHSERIPSKNDLTIADRLRGRSSSARLLAKLGIDRSYVMLNDVSLQRL
jgi:hypothetical protein